MCSWQTAIKRRTQLRNGRYVVVEAVGVQRLVVRLGVSGQHQLREVSISLMDILQNRIEQWVQELNTKHEDL